MRLRIVFQVLAAAVLFGAALAAYLPQNTVGGWADDRAAAARALIWGERSFEAASVVVVALDEASVNDPRLAATPRALMSPIWAEIALKALDHGAEAVALDFIIAFDGIDLVVDGETPLRRYDTPFLRMLAKEGRAGRLIIGRSQRLLPGRRFSAAARERGVAFVDIDADPDGVVRRVRARFTTEAGEVAATLSGAILGAEAAVETRITPPAPLTMLPAVNVADLLACDDEAALRSLFAGRAVLVGGALPGEDRFRAPDRYLTESGRTPPTPCARTEMDVRGPGGDIPGVWLHAAAVDAARSGWALQPAPQWAVAAVAAVAAAVAGLTALTLAPSAAGAIALGIGLVGFGGAAAAQEAGMLFPAARAGFAALVGFTAGWTGRLLFLDRRARALRSSFGRYVAPELVERILAQERLPELDGEQRDVAVMFADLSGFTALSERVDGKTLTATVNKYLSIIAREVEASGGYVDKFIGDAVMAIWNAPVDLPDFERAAARAAISIRDQVEAAAEADAARGLPNFKIKVGLNSGRAIVGNVGDENRLNYTAVGDTVNIAARMEGLPSAFLTPVVMGAACADAIREEFAILEVASIQVKGRKEPVGVYAPYGATARPYFDRYEAALAAYRARDFASAADGWRALASEAWEGAALSGAMAGFADLTAAEALPDDWNGAVVMTTK
ncbi:MAG: adenylate/guanylate cyclase domain-containing protein [Pseudomonadota bacterium]